MGIRNTLRFYTYRTFAIAVIAAFMLAPPASSAFAQTDTVRVFLDAKTIARGYSVSYGNGAMAVTVRPHALPRPAPISIERVASRAEAQQRFPADAKHEFASDIFLYDAARIIPSDMQQSFLIDIKPLTITPWSSIAFFDRTSKQWKPLPTRAVSSETLRAPIPLPFAPVAVLQEKKSVGNTTVSALLAQTHAVLVADSAGKTLIAKNARLESPPASITKLMTALVFLDHNPGWKTRVMLQPSDSAQAARIPFAAQETVTAYDLFMGMLIGSHNNAANALARSTGMSEQAFIDAMNAKAVKLKMYHTSFTDASGLDPRNASTVEDAARLAVAAFKQKNIIAALATPSYTIKGLSSKRTYLVKTTNALLASATIKGKTGYIDESGYNFVGRAQGKKGVITVAVFGAPSSTARFDIVSRVLKLVQ